MASAAAQQMFNSLSPQEQAQVTASIAGNPNGLDDWYYAAAKAGDPRAIRAGGAGQSEDFDRFNAGTVTGWAQRYYDEAASRAAGRPQFRSMRGEQGFFDKPTECPPGMGPSGPNESDPCTTKGYSEPAGGAGSAGGGGGAQGGYTGAGVSGGPNWSGYSVNPLAGLLMAQGGIAGQARQGGAMQGGGTWWSRNAPARPLEAKQGGGMTLPSTPGQYGGINPGASTTGRGGGMTLPSTPGQYGGINPGANTSSLTGLLTPLQSQTAPQGGLTGAVMPFQTRRKPVDPLTGMLSGFGTQQGGGGWF